MTPSSPRVSALLALTLSCLAPACAGGPDSAADSPAAEEPALAPLSCDLAAAEAAVTDDALSVALTHLDRCVRVGGPTEQTHAATRMAELAAAAEARRVGRELLAEGRCEEALPALQAAAPVLPDVAELLPEAEACAAAARHERLLAAVARSEHKLDRALSPLRVSFRPVGGADRWDVVVAGTLEAWTGTGDAAEAMTAAAAAVCAESAGTPWPSRNLELRLDEETHSHTLLSISTKECRSALRQAVGARGVREIRALVRDER